MKLAISMTMAIAAAGCFHLPKEPDDDLIGVCQGACSKLVKLACESSMDECVDFCTDIQMSGFVSLDLKCVMNGNTQADMLKCNIECQTK